ncbi:uncharacterized protein LOC129607558 [Condylostylus longicornis]|uniref:uncharacterized protein LOC129607558 n=1 Tax=Condylostylus longicornis TaxID=2530218 RepID=UPI00244E0392|nr:uncharacterized protein LOC129607558 [Condylostylus longicornis]
MSFIKMKFLNIFFIVQIIAINNLLIEATVNDILRKHLTKEQLHQLELKLNDLEIKVNNLTTEALKKGINNEAGICAYNELKLEHAGKKSVERAQLCIEERTDKFKNVSSFNNFENLFNIVNECLARSEDIEKKIITMFLNCDESHNVFDK